MFVPKNLSRLGSRGSNIGINRDMSSRYFRPKGSAAGIRESLKRLQQSHEIAAIVLVGDAPSFSKGKFGERTDWHIPTFY